METTLLTPYSKEFTDFVTNGVAQKYYIGTGNPNAKVLFIGKESAIAKEDMVGRDRYSQNASDWRLHVEKNTCEILNYEVDNQNSLRKGWGRNTWSKYQKLSDVIFNKEPKPFHVDFLENIFTTEINDAPEKSTSLANKSSIINRKTLFKNSAYIQSFPVVVLACSDYIVNNNDDREIDELFQVTYAGDRIGRYCEYSKGNWFYLHYNQDKTKLVIHTRQLSADVSNQMLEDMGKVIRDHLIAIGVLAA